MEEASGTKDLSELAGLDESDLLSIPEDNLPPSLLPEFLERRQEAIQKKQAVDESGAEARLVSEKRTKEERDIEDARRFRMEYEAYQAEMCDIYAREDILLHKLEIQEKEDRKRLAEIDRRALRLSDGRLAYVGSNGTYVDQQGQLLHGKDEAEARAQNKLHPNAATWAEHSAMKQQIADEKRLRQNIQDMQAQQKREDRGELSGEQMAANRRERSAAISRYETEYAEEFESKSAAAQQAGGTITNADYGGDDYMAAYGASGGSLTQTFTKAADGTGAVEPNTKPQPDEPRSAPVQTLSR